MQAPPKKTNASAPGPDPTAAACTVTGAVPPVKVQMYAL